MFNIIYYTSPNGNAPAAEFIQDLLETEHKNKIFYKLRGLITQLENYGLKYKERNPKAIKHLCDGIFELKALSARVLFFCVKGNTIILLHGFEKKTQKTPKGEIEKAIKEKKEYLRGN